VKLHEFPEDYVRAAVQTAEGKINTFDEVPAYVAFYFDDNFTYNPEGVAKHFIPENKQRLIAVRSAFAALSDFNTAELEGALRTTAANLFVKLGALIHPTRLAVTGTNAGPSLYHLLEVLGKKKVLARVDRALASFA
jgi:glutamyl-tRNA synthetase